MAYTSLGYSLPDLAIVDAFAGPVAAYGGPVSVTVNVDNLGASSMVEPLALAPGATSSADAAATTVDVYLVRGPHSRPTSGVLLGSIDVPALSQKRLARITGTVNMPAAPPPGFPDVGGTTYLSFVVDRGKDVPDYDRTNNFTRRAVPVLLTPNLPQLESIAFNTPDNLAPGDSFIPEVKIGNYGSSNTNLQAPVVVLVVASQDKNFGPGDQTLATFTVSNVVPLSQSPTKKAVLGDVNLTDPPNVEYLNAGTATILPASPSEYFVGVIVDPYNQIREIDELDRDPSSALSQVKLVRPNNSGLPAAGIIGTPNPADNPFPYFPNTTGTTVATPVSTGVLPTDLGSASSRRSAGQVAIAEAVAARRASARAASQPRIQATGRVQLTQNSRVQLTQNGRLRITQK